MNLIRYVKQNLVLKSLLRNQNRYCISTNRIILLGNNINAKYSTINKNNIEYKQSNIKEKVKIDENRFLLKNYNKKSFSKTNNIILHGGHHHGDNDVHELLLDNTEKASDVKKKCIRITKIGIWSNVGLAIFKGIGGIIGSSTALIADAVHSFSDLCSDFVTLYAVKKAHEKSSKKFPYGQGRMESIGSLTIATILVYSSLMTGYHSAQNMIKYITEETSSKIDELTVSSLIHSDDHNPILDYFSTDLFSSQTPGVLALSVVAISILVKEYLYRITLKVGKETNSSVVMGNAWHHRSDSLSSIFALIGISGSYFFDLLFLDPLSGIVVAMLIGKVGLNIGRDSIYELTDRVVDKKILKELKNIIEIIPDVDSYHNLRARKMGPYYIVDLQIAVDPLLSISSAHQIAERVRSEIMKKNERVNEMLVHIVPKGSQNITSYDENEKQTSIKPFLKPMKEVEQEVNNILKLNFSRDIKEISHFTMYFIESKLHIKIEVVMDTSLTVKQASKIASNVEKKLVDIIEYIDEVDIHLEVGKEITD